MASSEQLEEFLQISELCPQPPWFAMLEGRDHFAGDTFVMVGVNGLGGDDLYIYDTGPGPYDVPLLDLIALMRNQLPDLCEELLRLRSGEQLGRVVSDVALDEMDASLRLVPPAPWRALENSSFTMSRSVLREGETGTITVRGYDDAKFPEIVSLIVACRNIADDLIAELRDYPFVESSFDARPPMRYSRLRTTEPKMAALIEKQDSPALRRIAVAAAQWATDQAPSGSQVIQSALDQLRRGEVERAESVSEIVNAVVDDLYELAWRILDKVDAGERPNSDFLSARSQARAASSVLCALESDPLSSALESVYEASVVTDSRDELWLLLTELTK